MPTVIRYNIVTGDDGITRLVPVYAADSGGAGGGSKISGQSSAADTDQPVGAFAGTMFLTGQPPAGGGVDTSPAGIATPGDFDLYSQVGVDGSGDWLPRLSLSNGT